MTSVTQGDETVCAWCGSPVPGADTGRPPKFCAARCRQAAYRGRATDRNGAPAPPGATAEEVAELRARTMRLEELVESLCDWAWMRAWRGPWRSTGPVVMRHVCARSKST